MDTVSSALSFLRQVALMVLFGAAGAAATVGLWHLFAWTVAAALPPETVVAWCFVVGLGGPVVVWAAVLAATRGMEHGRRRTMRRCAFAGSAIVLAAEAAFYVPVGLIGGALRGLLL